MITSLAARAASLFAMCAVTACATGPHPYYEPSGAGESYPKLGACVAGPVSEVIVVASDARTDIALSTHIGDGDEGEPIAGAEDRIILTISASEAVRLDDPRLTVSANGVDTIIAPARVWTRDGRTELDAAAPRALGPYTVGPNASRIRADGLAVRPAPAVTVTIEYTMPFDAQPDAFGVSGPTITVGDTAYSPVAVTMTRRFGPIGQFLNC